MDGTVLTIKNTGKVGIGTTNPAHGLDVDGAMYSRRHGLTDGATIAVDWNNGNTQSVTLGGAGVDSKYDCVAQRMNF